MKVCILNYGSGNVRSVYNMISKLVSTVVISNEPSDIESSSHLILPGVGAFGASIKKIREKMPMKLLEAVVHEGQKPFLGICVGMQVLADKGFEFGEHEGLGWIPGVVRKLESGGHPLPHVGWNDISNISNTPILKGLKEIRDFYFVHSYAFCAEDKKHVCAVAEYGEVFDCVVSKGNIFGVQFHPEKSQRAGQLLIKNFLEISSEEK